MPNTDRKLRVFLCHSSNDKPTVRELYRRLEAEGWIDVWLDEEKLYPGQDWNFEIEKAVEESDVILVCLTKNSVNKEGYVQRELRIVLDLADYKPEGTLFVIPIRLEECEPPRRLRPWQYADYFPKKDRERAYERLLISLRMRANRLDISTAKPAVEALEQETGKGKLPDFRVRQRDYLLEISRILTQELDLEKLLARTLKIGIEMLAGQAGLIALKEQEGWHVAAAHGIAPAFLSYLTPLLAEENARKFDVDELNRMLKELTYTASMGLLNGTALPLVTRGQVIGEIFIFRNYPDKFTDNDRMLLQSFADQAAIAVFNAKLFGQTSRNTLPKEKIDDEHSNTSQVT